MMETSILNGTLRIPKIPESYSIREDMDITKAIYVGIGPNHKGDTFHCLLYQNASSFIELQDKRENTLKNPSVFHPDENSRIF